MKLLQQKHSEYKGKKYLKSWIVIPHEIIKKLNWQKGDELEANVKEDKLTIKKQENDDNTQTD